jgi:hypothetical protein
VFSIIDDEWPEKKAALQQMVQTFSNAYTGSVAQKPV